MKKLILSLLILIALAVLLQVGTSAFKEFSSGNLRLQVGATSVPWVATSTTQGWVSPARINGTEQAAVVNQLIGTSTDILATSTVAADFSVRGSGTRTLKIETTSGAGARGSVLEFRNANNGSNDTCGTQNFFANAANPQNSARIDCFLSTSGSTGVLRFFTSNAGTAGLTERLRIASNGLVGIGTTTAGTMLTVVNGTSIGAGVTSPTLTLSASYGAVTSVQTIDFLVNGSVTNPAVRVGAATNASGGGGEFIVSNTNSFASIAPTEKLRLTSTGNLGVGTTTPTQLISSSDNISWGSNNEGLLTWSTSAGGSASVRATTGRALKLQSNNGNQEITLTSAGLVGIATTTPAVQFDQFSTGTSTQRLDSNSTTQGGCMIFKDTDGSGYTQVVANNGVLTAKINTTGTTCN